MWKTTDNVRISVIVPVYNAEEYIVQMIESVLMQTFSNWKMILIESASDDNSLMLCKLYEEKYPNIHVIETEKRGPGYARNEGLKYATGDYIVFMDSDDYLSNPNVFSDFVMVADSVHADITVCNYERLWKGKLLQAAKLSQFAEFSSDSEEFRFRGFFSIGTLSYVWGKLYRRTFLEEHRLHFSDFEYAEDKLFNLQCYICGARYAFVQENGYVYRKNEQSISHQYKMESSKCWLGIAQELKNWIESQTDVHNIQERKKQERLIDYTIFFASFFDSKMEYVEHKKSVLAARRVLRLYGKESIGKESFEKLVKAKKKELPNQILWRIMLRGFSFGMWMRCYGLLAIGIKILIDQRVDERLSDTGLRE